jgi:hypothetical protein
VGFLTIDNVQVFGADADITESVHSLVIAQLSGGYMHIFPRSNILIYPKLDIVNRIKQQFPRILDVSIGRDGFKSLNVSVSEKTPSALVCITLPNFSGSQLVFNQSDDCYFADSTGLLFQKSPGFADHPPYNVYFAPDAVDAVGGFATSTSEFNLLQSFYSGAQNAGMHGDAILMKENGEFELYASSTTIYFNDEKGIGQELSNLVTFWNHMVNQEHVSKKPVDFDYIDLRYDSNIFYKIAQ